MTKMTRLTAQGVRQTLTNAGFGGSQVRKGVLLGGYVVPRDNQLTEVVVFWRPGDEIPDDQIDDQRLHMLEQYATCLEARGYRTRISWSHTLRVTLPDSTTTEPT